MHCDWLPGGVHTHTSGDTASQVFSHLISSVCVYVSKAEPVSQPDLHVVYRQTMLNCPWIGELASSPTESSKAFDTKLFKGLFNHNHLWFYSRLLSVMYIIQTELK